MRLWVLLGVAACGVSAPSAAPADPPAQSSLEVTNAELEAEGLTLEMQRGRLDPEGRGTGEEVHATTDREEPPLDIVAETTAWDLREHTASFRTNVVLTRGALRLTTDALELTLSSDPSPRVTHALASGSVGVTRGTQAATADQAQLNAETGVLVLTGNPTLRDGPHTLRGERIRFWLEEDRVECDACRVQVQGGIVLP